MRKLLLPAVLIFLVFAAGCSFSNPASIPTAPVSNNMLVTSTLTSTATLIPTSTITLTPTETEIPTETPVVFEVGEELTIEYLRNLEITGSEITIEEKLNDRSNYHQYLASYISEGNKIYGLLTIPFDDPPEGGYPAVVFCHGYIPPDVYQTRERYEAYVDYIARNGFVVFKIDYRGHGQSEGEAVGSYFSPGYTIDAISALKSLQTLDVVAPDRIGMWGHSMAGNLVLRAMLIEPDVRAGVIWAGAVYSYEDLVEYGISDTSYHPSSAQRTEAAAATPTGRRAIFDLYGEPDSGSLYWQAVSLTANIEYLNSPIQLHHAEDDTVVNIGYSMGLASVLNANSKTYEFYVYPEGGHNINTSYWSQAMARTVAFFQEYLGN